MIGKMVQSKTHKKLAKLDIFRIFSSALFNRIENCEGKLASLGDAPLMPFGGTALEGGFVSAAVSGEENRVNLRSLVVIPGVSRRLFKGATKA
jgi:hypothetical protein